ncbi:MAG TPA: YfiR family protein [Kofleriaceae bacterium]|nr:YfiR family protein [Kofleriaceae bacterium]
MKRALGMAVVAALVLAMAGRASAEVQADKQALIMLRVLAYDYARAGGNRTPVRLAIVHGESHASLACATSMRRAFDTLALRVKVNGRPLEVQALSAGQIDAAGLHRRRISVAYVCRESSGSRTMRSLTDDMSVARVLTFSDRAQYLTDGVAITLAEEGARVGISVNLVAAEAQGARLGAQFLRLSKVVRR